MRLTKQQLKQIIKEELEAVVDEASVPDYVGGEEGLLTRLARAPGRYMDSKKEEKAANLAKHFRTLAKNLLQRGTFTHFGGKGLDAEPVENPTEEQIDAFLAGPDFDSAYTYRDPYATYGISREDFFRFRHGSKQGFRSKK